MPETLSLILKGINAGQVLLNHYYNSSPDLPETPVAKSQQKDIEITDLLKERSNRCIYFVDPHKQKIKCWVSMVDITQGMVMPLYTTKKCWWHREKIPHHPLGIPIRYSPQKLEGVEKDRLSDKFKELNYNVESNDFFETIGMVCSFPCMKAYILDQLSRSKSSRFKNSLTLMTLLYSKLFGKIITIPTAPTWKLLKQYGGHLTPEEYISSFGRLEYTETVNIRRPYMFSSSNYIQEQRIRF